MITSPETASLAAPLFAIPALMRAPVECLLQVEHCGKKSSHSQERRFIRDVYAEAIQGTQKE